MLCNVKVETIQKMLCIFREKILNFQRMCFGPLPESTEKLRLQFPMQSCLSFTSQEKKLVREIKLSICLQTQSCKNVYNVQYWRSCVTGLNVLILGATGTGKNSLLKKLFSKNNSNILKYNMHRIQLAIRKRQSFYISLKFKLIDWIVFYVVSAIFQP